MIPFLMNNCSTWIKMKKSDIERLSKLQNLFLNTILNVQHCPIPLMYLDLSIMTIPSRILKEKLILYHHISCLLEKSVAHQIMVIQKLFTEIEEFLIRNEISDVTQFSKRKWKLFVKKKITSNDRESLLEMAKSYKKIEYSSLQLEEHGIKDYFSYLNLNQARIKFRERANCMKTCKRHFSSDKFNIKTMFSCESCSSDDYKIASVDVLSQWRVCSSYRIFRKSRDLSKDSDLVAYYQDIISMWSSEERN